MNTTIESQFRRFALWNLVISLSLFLPNSSPLLAATVFAQPESLSKEEPQRVRDSLAEFRPEMRRQVVNYHLEQAQHWFDKNDFSKARRELSEALKWDPRNPIGRSLMTRALEEIVIQDRIRREQEKHVAQLIEQDQIREKFLDKVEEMNREMMELTMEGNAHYRAGKLQEANQKYQQVLSVQAEKQNVTNNLIEKIKKRTNLRVEDLNEFEKQIRIEHLLKDAERSMLREEWNKAADTYESIFLIDPQSQKASRGMDRLKKSFIKKEKERRAEEAKSLEERFQSRVDFYLDQAESAFSNEEYEKANKLTQIALQLDSRNKKAKDILNRIKKSEPSHETRKTVQNR